MIFHLAIPSGDIERSCDFYASLGGKIGRKYKDSAIIDFFGCQLVLHLSEKWDRQVFMYPRHFGVILPTQDSLKSLWNSYIGLAEVFQEYFVRHEKKPEEHHTFFLSDPFNNLIEFKWYKDPKFNLS